MLSATKSIGNRPVPSGLTVYLKSPASDFILEIIFAVYALSLISKGILLAILPAKAGTLIVPKSSKPSLASDILDYLYA